MTTLAGDRTHQVVVIGLGVSGLAVFRELQRAGIRDILILERDERLGGTWRDNAYPGCACDVESALYSFSFSPNPNWSRVYAPQAEIQTYLEGVADELGVARYVDFGCEVRGAVWIEDEQMWILDTNRGRVKCQFLVGATGPLSAPRIPNLPGMDRFSGTVAHTGKWPTELSLTGKRVAVVGTGASAIQLVPALQPEVEHLTLFQRTPAWVLPRRDHAISSETQAGFRKHPWQQALRRRRIRALRELIGITMTRKPKWMKQAEKLGREHLRDQVSDPELRATLTPDYLPGCKRILLSNDFYPSLEAPNVTLIPEAAESLHGNSLVAVDGSRARDLDAIVFATGFFVTDPPLMDLVRGRNNETLREHYDGCPRAFLGTVASGFPNLFIMTGPNTGIGHTSLIIHIEAQARYIARALTWSRRSGVRALEVRANVQSEYNEQLQRDLAESVWTTGGCSSWYQDEKGEVSAIWPGTSGAFERRLARSRLGDYVGPASHPEDTGDEKLP